jgi:ParB family transcriptional regulator, chromosome partitioning protein
VSKNALGKGIEALLQSNETDSSEKSVSLVSVPIDKIHANPNQPRQKFEQNALKELADSIREKGIIQPVIAEEDGKGSYLLIAGERRLRAAHLAGLAEVPVLPRKYTEEEKYEIALIENLHREDLSPIEEAKAFIKIIEDYSLSQDELSKKIGKNRSTIANSIRLLNLPEEMQAAVDERALSAGHARCLLSVINGDKQKILFDKIVAEGLSVRTAEKIASELNNDTDRIKSKPALKAGSIANVSTDLLTIENTMIEILGTKVSIKGSEKRGKIEIHYYSLDDLNRIFEILEK